MPKQDANDGIIFVSYKEDERGRQIKPAMSYITPLLMQSSNRDKVLIRARGRAISKAVDVSQIALNKFLKGWGMGNISVGTEEYEKEVTENNQTSKVNAKISYIDIELIKNR